MLPLHFITKQGWVGGSPISPLAVSGSGPEIIGECPAFPPELPRTDLCGGCRTTGIPTVTLGLLA